MKQITYTCDICNRNQPPAAIFGLVVNKPDPGQLEVQLRPDPSRSARHICIDCCDDISVAWHELKKVEFTDVEKGLDFSQGGTR